MNIMIIQIFFFIKLTSILQTLSKDLYRLYSISNILINIKDDKGFNFSLNVNLNKNFNESKSLIELN